MPAIVLTATITLTLAFFSTFISALTISTIVRLMAYMSTCAALPVLRHNPRFQRRHLSSEGTVVAVVAIALSVWLLTNAPWNELRLAAIAVLLGLVVYTVGAPGSRQARSAAGPIGH